MKIRILTATTEKQSKQGCHLTEEGLKQLADSKGSVPTTWGFDTRQQLGKVIDKEITHMGLVEVEAIVLPRILEQKVYLVPSYLE